MRSLRIQFGSALAKLVAALMLFSALGRHPYDYFILLRWISFGVCAFTAFQAAEAKKFGWLWLLTITALILNPIVPLRLKRETWNIVDVVAGAILVVSIAVIDIRKPS
jgi:hypothetical protein